MMIQGIIKLSDTIPMSNFWYWCISLQCLVLIKHQARGGKKGDIRYSISLDGITTSNYYPKMDDLKCVTFMPPGENNNGYSIHMDFHNLEGQSKVISDSTSGPTPLLVAGYLDSAEKCMCDSKLRRFMCSKADHKNGKCLLEKEELMVQLIYPKGDE